MAFTSSARFRAQIEKRFLLSVISGQEHGPIPDLFPLCQLAQKEKAAGLLCRYLQTHGHKPPPALWRAYWATAASNLLLVSALSDIDAHLGQDVLAIKGMALIHGAYPDPGLRPMEDLDILIRPQDLLDVTRALEKVGFTRNPCASHLFHRQKIILDLHTHTLNTARVPARAALFPPGMEPVWENSLALDEKFSRIRMPDPQDCFLLCAQHAMKHSFAGLTWLADLISIKNTQKETFPQLLVERAVALGQEKPLAYALYLAGLLVGHEPFLPVTAALNPSLSRPEKTLLKAIAARVPATNLGDLLSLLAIPSWADRARFARDLTFPEKNLAQKAYVPPDVSPHLFHHLSRAYHAGFLGVKSGLALLRFLAKK